MSSAIEITRLCEAWWERLSDSTKADHQQYAAQFLSILGWTELTPINTTSGDTALSSVSFVLRGGAQSAVAAHFMMPGSLEPPMSLVERGLDFCEGTRLLVNGTRKLNVGYAFITDLFRSYLYDAQTDELLVHADSPEGFNHELAGILSKSAIERGSLEEIRRIPRSASARQLREWCHRWCETLVNESGQPKDVAFLAIDRLLVLRFLFDHDILKRSGWRLRKRFSDVVAKAFSHEPHDCGHGLTTLFHDIWFDWKAELFRPVPALDAALEEDRITGPMLKEFALLSKTKFTIATILESFNFGEAMEKARVRLVPEPDEERAAYVAKQSMSTVDEAHIEVDVLEEGYRAIFYWFDQMVALYGRLGMEFDTRAYHGSAAQGDMDLFAWSELDANRPGALRDKFQHVVEKGLTVLYASPRQYRTARLLLYLHLISRYKATQQRFTQFPPIESVFKERPVLLDSEKKFIYQPPPDPNADPWDVV